MKEIWTGRFGQAAATYGEHAPVATACCNACRACVTGNILTIATAGLAASAPRIRRAFRRFTNLS